MLHSVQRTPFPSTPSQQMLRSTCWGLCISASSALMFKTPICRASPSPLMMWTKCECHHLEHLVLYKWNKLLKISSDVVFMSKWLKPACVIDVMKLPNWYFSCVSAVASRVIQTFPVNKHLVTLGRKNSPLTGKRTGIFERGKYLIMVWVSV